MKFFDIGATVEAAVRGIAQYDLDFLTVHGDPHAVRAAKEGRRQQFENFGGDDFDVLDRQDLDNAMIKDGKSLIWSSNGQDVHLMQAPMASSHPPKNRV